MASSRLIKLTSLIANKKFDIALNRYFMDENEPLSVLINDIKDTLKAHPDFDQLREFLSYVKQQKWNEKDFNEAVKKGAKYIYQYVMKVQDNSNVDYNKALDYLIKDDEKGEWIHLAGKNWKNIDYEKALDALIQKDNIGWIIHQAGIDWPKFNYEKGIDALIKIYKRNKSAGNDDPYIIYQAGFYWPKFNYEKGLNILKGNSYYYKRAFNNWPKGAETTKKMIDQLKKKAKKMPTKRLKLKEENELNLVKPLYNQNLPSKVKIRKQDIFLQFLLARDLGNTYKVSFLLTLNPKEKIQNPELLLTPRNVDMVSLKNAILQSIQPYDRKYMILKNYDTKKAEFILDTKKWINDAMSTIRPITTLHKFSRVFRLKTQPPRMILYDPMSAMFGKFVLRQFNNYMIQRAKYNTWFKSFLPDNLRRNIRAKVRNMFDWEYDMQWNSVTAKLKNIYVLALLFSIGYGAKKISDYEIKRKEKDFAQRVKQNIRTFDMKKFEKYVKRKGFI